MKATATTVKEINAEAMAHIFANASKVVLVDIESLDRNPIQYPKREQENIKDLSHDIAITQFVVPIVVVKNPNDRHTVIDGHRRWQAMLGLKAKRIPAIILHSAYSVTLLFLILNRSIKRIGAAQLFFAWAQENPAARKDFLDQITGPTRNNIDKMVKVFGLADAVRLADGNMSPYIVTWVDRTQNIIVGKDLAPLPAKQIGLWMIRHHQINVINGMKRNPDLPKKEAERLRKAIVANRPLGGRAGGDGKPVSSHWVPRRPQPSAGVSVSLSA